MQAWLNYSLINIFGRPGKFYPDNCFGETIIKLNIKKVRLSSKAKSDIFLCKTVALNLMSLWKSKKVLAEGTGATSHSNCHSVVESYPNMQFLPRLIVESSIFLPQSSRGSELKKFKDLLAAGSTIIEKSIPINWYKNQA